MKYLGPAFLTAAAMLGALTIAIAREGDHLGRYEWAVPYLTGVIVLCVILGVVSLLSAGRQQQKRRDSLPLAPPQSQHNDQRLEANPQQIVNIGLDLLQAAPESQSNEPPPPKPNANISFVQAVTTTAHADTQHGSTIYESPQGLGDFKVCVVRFRNDAIVGPIVEQPDLMCHIVYKDASGNEITDSPRGVWLDHYGESVEFETGKKRSVVVFLLSSQDTLKKIWNESYYHSDSWMNNGRPSFRIRHEGIPSKIASVEISLLTHNSCILQAVFRVEGREEDKLPTLTLISISGVGLTSRASS
jgi:hypothetical protein